MTSPKGPAGLFKRLRAMRARDLPRLPNLIGELAPLDLRIVGRTLLHTVLVGIIAGFIGAGFFWLIEVAQTEVLEAATGYVPLRAQGELLLVGGSGEAPAATSFRPWFLWVLPALGGLLCGLVVRFVPEVSGGGADTTIEAYHHKGGVLRRRIIWAKPLASFFTLGTGGAGGREGPTMLIGGAVGSLVGRVLRLGVRERRILLVAGVAAGIAAVFRTPLGAALLAVEFLYRDDFESDALVPAILASVVAYSVVISLFGESILFAHAPRYPFTPSHLPLYALMAVVLALFAHISIGVMGGIRRLMQRLPGPVWLRPAWGGLFLGIFVTPIVMGVGELIGAPGQGLGLLGGGYGAVQTAISGAPWLPGGWLAVGLLLLLAFAKLIATSFTIGSGGSAGDFAPSLAIGALIGGAFGYAAQILIDPAIDPGAFALVGMGAFYGGLAHVPLSALVLVCEMAGSYDLLVPLMLALGVCFVAVRRRTLYPAQLPTQRDSPVHREEALVTALESTRVRDVMAPAATFASFVPGTEAAAMLHALAAEGWQDTFPVRGLDNHIVGIVRADDLRALTLDPGSTKTARDVMGPSVVASPDESLRAAAERLIRNHLREMLVVDGHTIIGFLDEDHITEHYLGTLTRVAGPRRSQTVVDGVKEAAALAQHAAEESGPTPAAATPDQEITGPTRT